MLRWIITNWFLVAVVAVLLLAWAVPDLGRSAGWLHLDQLRDILVVGIFLITGLTLRTRELGASLGQWRLHLAVHVSVFAVVPALFYLLVIALRATGMPDTLLVGMMILGCLPTTIASCTIMTKEAGGNLPAALFNATTTNILGVFITPLLVLWTCGLAAEIDVWPVFRKLSLLVLLPVIVGQLVRIWLRTPIETHRRRLSIIANSMLLLILLQSLSNAFLTDLGAITPSQVWFACIIAALACMVVLALCWWGMGIPLLHFSMADRIAATLCGSQKTIALGIPLISLMFDGDPRLGLLMLPALAYHPCQLIVGSIILPRWRRLVENTHHA